MTPQKLKNIIRLSTFFIVTFVIFVTCVIAYQCIKIGSLNASLKALEQQSASLTVQQQQLEHGIEVKRTASYVEQEAREQYGLAQEGDIIYIQK